MFLSTLEVISRMYHLKFPQSIYIQIPISKLKYNKYSRIVFNTYIQILMYLTPRLVTIYIALLIMLILLAVRTKKKLF